MKQLVFATNNSHKLREVREIVGSSFEILSLKEIGCFEEIPETAETIEGNALLKARFVKERYGYDCFADDTGLEIEALNNEPGVYSARYAGPECMAENNIRKILAKLEGIDCRDARFKTIVALICDGETHTFEGIVQGRITTEKHGECGFGYDPVFLPEGYTTTFAEMDETEKNKISHRGRAVQKLMAFLTGTQPI